MSVRDKYNSPYLKVLILFFGLQPLVFNAQNSLDNSFEIIEKRIEYLIEDVDESAADYSTLFDQFSYYYQHPLNLNRANLSEFEELGLLSSVQINSLLAHIEKNGKLMSLLELQSVDGFNAALIQLLLPFVKVSSQIDDAQLSFKELLRNGGSTLFLRYTRVLEEKKGFSSISDTDLIKKPNARYLGGEEKLYLRYRFKYGNHLSLGFTAEKDAGEDFFTRSQPQGFDFYSGHFFIKNQGRIKQLALGDYQAQFGQGLTYWSGVSFGKSADIIQIKRSAVGLKPYTSVEENHFLRGGGLSLRFNNIETTVFYARNRKDANLVAPDTTSGSQGVNSITAFQQSGFHRTINELTDKDAIVQQQFGGHLAYKIRQINIGVTSVFSEIDANFKPRKTIYNQFRNDAEQQVNYGIDYNWVLRNFNFFGEFSRSLKAGDALVSGAIIALDPKLSVAVLYRNYDNNFHPISSAGLGESSTNDNEKGVYIGLITQPFKMVTLSAYYDRFVFPWLKFGVDAPSNGNQYLIQLNYRPSKKMELYFRVRARRKLENRSSPLIEGIPNLVEEDQRNFRVHLAYKVSENVQLKSRIEWVHYEKGNGSPEAGYLIYQDVIYKSKNSPISLAFRYALFDTPSYNTRIYAYENDVLYVFSIPAYYNRGVKTYLSLRYKLFRGVDLWLRYGVTIYDNIDVISTGLEQIQGNHKQEIKMQLRVKF